MAVGAAQVQGKWVPEQHWPSVKYQPRNGTEKKRNAPVTPDAGVPDGSAILAESASQ